MTESEDTTIDLDTASDTLTTQQVAALTARKAPTNRPDISRLPDAFDEEGMPRFRRADKIIIERYASFLKGTPYLDTRSYRVVSVDSVTGRLELYDDELQQQALDDWKHGMSIGQVYKLPAGRAVPTRKKRGRPRKDAYAAPPPPPPVGPDGKPVKKRRGRPKGSKNRSKDEIRAEKTARKSAQVERHAKRSKSK